ncbi:MAG: hypothetical protein QOC66_153 [Pseudonocardiales bacterium]|nr:hypothetical protein [Pseudonocardiales bacterium]
MTQVLRAPRAWRTSAVRVAGRAVGWSAAVGGFAGAGFAAVTWPVSGSLFGAVYGVLCGAPFGIVTAGLFGPLSLVNRSPQLFAVVGGVIWTAGGLVTLNHTALGHGLREHGQLAWVFLAECTVGGIASGPHALGVVRWRPAVVGDRSVSLFVIRCTLIGAAIGACVGSAAGVVIALFISPSSAPIAALFAPYLTTAPGAVAGALVAAGRLGCAATQRLQRR